MSSSKESLLSVARKMTARAVGEWLRAPRAAERFRPRDDDFDKVFRPGIEPPTRATFAPEWSPPAQPGRPVAHCRIAVAWARDLEQSADERSLRGYAPIAHRLTPEIPWAGAVLLDERGDETGVLSGLAFIAGRLAWFPSLGARLGLLPLRAPAALTHWSA